MQFLLVPLAYGVWRCPPLAVAAAAKRMSMISHHNSQSHILPQTQIPKNICASVIRNNLYYSALLVSLS